MIRSLSMHSPEMAHRSSRKCVNHGLRGHAERNDEARMSNDEDDEEQSPRMARMGAKILSKENPYPQCCSVAGGHSREHDSRIKTDASPIASQQSSLNPPKAGNSFNLSTLCRFLIQHRHCSLVDGFRVLM
jgi:hypothetical protein